jgi:hypothetical protein
MLSADGQFRLSRRALLCPSSDGILSAPDTAEDGSFELRRGANKFSAPNS